MIVLGGTVVTPTGLVQGGVALEDGRIREIGPSLRASGASYDFGQAWILPGFIDEHMHGLGRYGVFPADELVEVARLQCRFGTTGFLPSVASCTQEQYLEFGRNVLAAQEKTGPDAAEILGAHFEGPFINPLGKAGMDADFLRPVDLEECRSYLDAMGKCLKLMTLSPELAGSEALIRLLRRHDVVVSLGHSRATADQLQAAVRAGLTQVCHLFNAFERDGHDPDWPWAPGLLEAILQSDRLNCEVICDMVHVSPRHVQLAAAQLGPERFLAITDSLPGAGLDPGEYTMVDGRRFTTCDGAARLVADGMLVGSVLTLNRAFGNLIERCNIDPVCAARFTSTNAARALGLGEQLGSIEIGKRANLAVLDADYRCLATFVDGRRVHGN